MKWIASVTKLAAVAMFAAAVSAATTWAMVQAYVQQLIHKLPVQGLVETITPADALSALTEPSPLPGSGGEPRRDEVAGTGGGAETIAPAAEASPEPPGALEVMGRIELDGTLSLEDLNEWKEELTAEERNWLFSLMTRLPPDEVQRLSELVEDGLTAVEMEEAARILQTHLSREEYEALLDMLSE